MSEATGGKFANGAATAAFSAVVSWVSVGAAKTASAGGTEAYSLEESMKAWTEEESRAIDSALSRESYRARRQANLLERGIDSSIARKNAVFGVDADTSEVAGNLNEIGEYLRDSSASDIGKMTGSLHVGGDAIAVYSKGKIYLSKTFVNGLVSLQAQGRIYTGTTFIHEAGHAVFGGNTIGHRGTELNLVLGITARKSIMSRAMSVHSRQNLEDAYAYEVFLNE